MSVESLLYPTQWQQELTTWYWTRVLTDEVGNPLGSSQIDTLLLSYFSLDDPTHPVIGDWDAKNVKAANGGTITTTGKFEWRLPASDAILLDPTRPYETRGLLLSWTTLTGKAFHAEVHTAIRNLHRVGA